MDKVCEDGAQFKLKFVPSSLDRLTDESLQWTNFLLWRIFGHADATMTEYGIKISTFHYNKSVKTAKTFFIVKT